jgi:hypothetical protein
MFITENKGAQQWAKMLKENFNVQDTEKLNWVSEYASVHEIKESQIGQFGGGLQAPANGVGSLYATPLNTTGMGNVATPGAPSVGGPYAGAPDSGVANFFNQQTGSGDIPVSTLPMALNIALLTIGLELLPVIPAKGPWALLTYMDTPYAGGKLGGKNEIASIDGKGNGPENKPLYFKVIVPVGDIAKFRSALKEGDKVVFNNKTNGNVTGTFKTIGRMDGGIICQIVKAEKGSGDTKTNVSLKEVFDGSDITIQAARGTELVVLDIVDGKEVKAITVKASVDFAQTHVDFVDGFANFATGEKKPMSRAENETGTGNVIGLRLFSKWIAMGSYEVTATVTRQQLQDLPLYGVDAVSKVMEACQNEITQTINARILEHVFALGVTNAVKQKARQGVDLNLYIGTEGSKNLAEFGVKFEDIYGQDQTGSFTAVKNADVVTSAENVYSRQRRISSRVLAAANLIQVTGRRGRANWIVTNAQVATALQDCAGYVVAPMVNNLLQDGSRDLYQAGTLAGIKVYVDPYMDWDDCRICVGRKGNGNEPGAVFMPYILADTVSITAEGTMAPKMLVNSRYAIADAGFYPETQYFTFAVNNEYGWI